MKKLLEAIAATAEVMGQTISPTAAAVMAQDLAGYNTEAIFKALKHVRANSSRFNFKAIMDALDVVLPDGRPNPDEAWATAVLANDESETVVWTVEMQQAFDVSRHLLDFGDKVAARMAFKDAYDRLVREARESNIPVKWSASLGFDADRRRTVLEKAVEMKRLPSSTVAGLLPSPDDCGPIIGLLGNVSPLRLVSKDGTIDTPTKSADSLERIAKIKTMLKDRAKA